MKQISRTLSSPSPERPRLLSLLQICSSARYLRPRKIVGRLPFLTAGCRRDDLHHRWLNPSHQRPNSQLLGPPPPLLWSPPPPKSPLSLLDAATRTVAPPLVITAVSWQPCLSSPYQITPVSLSKLYTKRSF